MNCLLDTHLLLWAAGKPEKLSAKALQWIENPENLLYFSSASFWEIAIKNQLGRADFKLDARLLKRGLLDNGYMELSINTEHSLHINLLPTIHKDPFDRMLIAQATIEGMVLLTADATVAQYVGSIQKV